MNAHILAIYSLILSLYSKTLGIFLPFRHDMHLRSIVLLAWFFTFPFNGPSLCGFTTNCISSNISELKFFGTIRSQTRRKTGQGELDCGCDI
jgi:hypothetical protein